MKTIREVFSALLFASLVLAIPFSVLAADAAIAGVAPSESPWWHTLLINLFLAAGTFVLGMVGKLLNRLFDYIAEKSGWAFMARVDELMMEIANDIFQSQIQPMKLAKADGKITPEELNSFKDAAISRAKTYLGLKGIKKLGDIVNGAGVEAVLGAKLEKAVKASKVLGLAGKGPRLDPPNASS